jgi:DNA-binding FadR family transcriptional regulator
MERVGLVEQVEAQLERVIVLGMLPDCGEFGSEEKLARSYGVSRTTVREALRRLASRGLVVQRPGRKTRARALDESLTLENLGLALHHERSQGSRWLLEGYFSLKRQVTVELLADCAANASEATLELLGTACFALWDVACLRLGERCAQLEFELLKLAARVANRPGHLLLIQSLQRAFQGLAARVLPLMDCEALSQWANCAMLALHERDAEALQRKLPAMLRTCDERVLGRLAPVSREEASPQVQRAEERLQGRPTPIAHEEEAREAHPSLGERGLGCLAPAVEPTAEEGKACEAVPPTMDAHGLGCPETAVKMDDALAARPTVEERDLGRLTPVSEGSLPGAVFGNLSDSQTGFRASTPEGSPQPEPASAGPNGPTRVTARAENGPPCERQQPFEPSSRMRASTPTPGG